MKTFLFKDSVQLERQDRLVTHSYIPKELTPHIVRSSQPPHCSPMSLHCLMTTTMIRKDDEYLKDDNTVSQVPMKLTPYM